MQIQERINAIFEPKESEELPLIVLNDPESYDVWVAWRALGRKFLPSQVAKEPEALLHDILILQAEYRRSATAHDVELFEE